MKFTQLHDDFWILTGSVNIFLFRTGDRLVLIDTGFPRKSEKILRAARQIGQITDIILSHIHVDHTGNAAKIAAATGAKVWMHDADAKLLKQGIASAKGTKPARAFTYLFGPLMMLVYGTKVKAVSDITPLTDGQVINELGGITVHHLPGHSDGQIALTIPVGDTVIIFAADVLGNYPKIGLPYAVLDKSQMHASIRRLRDIAANADLMVFGHGKPLAAPFAGLDEFVDSLD